ncbi:Ig-like domain-containing protein [Nocardioides yefusunii]|uniref:Ig-like domain-containing protein n=1 Tax=Nocardioides yefusunii TaxID=2500546 RepID=A0ABW1R1R5_9ACTN|nr:Ig-like domain-containing protein [Nocardioides yefusunii]
MKTYTRRTGAVVAGTALAVSAALGGLTATAAESWFSGDVTSVADPHRTQTALTLLDAAGAPVTSGSTSAPIAALAAAGAAVGTGATHAQLFAHLPRSGSAAGAWPGVQVSGTDRFTGTGAVTAPSTAAGKPYVRITSDAYTVADLVAALPNVETGASFAGVYELRLRTSSSTGGLSDDYAAAWIKVDGNRWSSTTAPIPGDSSTPVVTPTAVATTARATWPRLTYGQAGTVTVTVTGQGANRPTGDVTLSTGKTVLGKARLASTGTAKITVAAGAVQPGKQRLTLTYAGVKDRWRSSTVAGEVTVAKGKVSAPSAKVTTRATVKKKGKVTVTVATAKGLATPSGKVTLTLTKGKKKVKVTKALSKGKAVVTLPKLAKGTWKTKITYAGDSRYVARTTAASKATRVRVTAK